MCPIFLETKCTLSRIREQDYLSFAQVIYEKVFFSSISYYYFMCCWAIKEYTIGSGKILEASTCCKLGNMEITGVCGLWWIRVFGCFYISGARWCKVLGNFVVCALTWVLLLELEFRILRFLKILFSNKTSSTSIFILKKHSYSILKIVCMILNNLYYHYCHKNS